MIYLVCKNYTIAKNIARIDFHLQSFEWAYVNSVRNLYGIEGEVCFCGRAREHPDYRLIVEVVYRMVIMDKVKVVPYDELRLDDSQI